jgi:hypothetical protein
LQHLQRCFSFNIIAVFCVGPLVLWYVGSDPCAQWSTVWLGCMPTLICTTGPVIGRLILFQCVVSHWDGPQEPRFLQQQFVWRDKSLPGFKKLRQDRLSAEVTSDILASPIFCFETALRALYWSAFIYRYTHTYDNEWSAENLTGTLSEAQRLFAVREVKLYGDQESAVRILVAWGTCDESDDAFANHQFRKIVICARGSSEAANWAYHTLVRYNHLTLHYQ